MINQLKEELEKIKIENAILRELLLIFSENKNENNKILDSKVIITTPDGKAQEGRAIKFHQTKKVWIVQKDNEKGTISVSPEQVKILYAGSDGLIDKKLWHNLIRLHEIESTLNGSELPKYFSDKDYVNIKVVKKYIAGNGYCYIDCEIFNYNPVQRIKILSAFSEIGSYLQLKISSGIITDIHHISKERYQNQE